MAEDNNVPEGIVIAEVIPEIAEKNNEIKQEELQALASVGTEQLTYTLLGVMDLPMIEAVVQPGGKVLAEPGRLISKPDGVAFRTLMGDGTEAGIFGKLKSAAKSMITGEDIMIAEFENTNSEPAKLRFGTVQCGHLVPLKLSDWGGSIVAMAGAYLTGSPGTKIQMCFKQSLGAAFFGGESLVLQKLEGDGAVILQGGGVVLREDLTPERPKIRVDTGCLVAFTENVDYSIGLAGGFKSMIFGGEGIFHATMSLKPGNERGTVWIESYPYSKFISQIKSMYDHV